MAAAPRDMTPGELTVRLDGLESNILAALKVIQDSMVTTQVLDAKFVGVDQRVGRLEKDHAEWKNESTRAHVQLEADSKTRHAETTSDMDKMNTNLRTKIDKDTATLHAEMKEIKSQRAEDEKDIKGAKRAQTNIWIAAGLAVAGSILARLIPGGLG